MNGAIKNVGMVGGGISLGLIITLAIGYGEVKKDVSHNIGDIKEVRVEVAKNTEDIDEEENLNIKQTTILDSLAKTVDALNRKLEKELAQ